MRIAVTDEQTRGFEWQIHPFVEIEADRIRLGDPSHPSPELVLIRQHSQCTERAVHEKPEILLAANGEERPEIVGGAGVHRAGGPDHTNGSEPRGTILGNGPSQRGEIDAISFIDGDTTKPRAP